MKRNTITAAAMLTILAATLAVSCWAYGGGSVVPGPRGGVELLLPAEQLSEVVEVPVPDSLRADVYLWLRRLMPRLDLGTWTAAVIWTALPDTVAARVSVRFDYRTVLLALDPGHVGRHSRVARCRVLLHELLHVLLAQLGGAVRQLAAAHGDETLDRAREIEEATVTHFERVLYVQWCTP